MDNNINPFSARTDILLPKPLESNVVLDINHVSCGIKPVALLTRQGEVFTGFEESGGCLGLGVGIHAVHPRLVESISASTIDFVICGEFHTCAVSIAGELHTWQHGTHNAGLLGHVPIPVTGYLKEFQASGGAPSCLCYLWDMTFNLDNLSWTVFHIGVLGHGKRVSCTQEVETVMGLKTIAVSCGVWHTAAVVEVMVTQSSGLSGKKFTWGDGLSDGKFPCLVEDKLATESVKDVDCGSYHVAELTTRGEVYTWGKGANRRLGHGELEDRKIPTLVEILKDRSVKSIACGSNFTTAICQHKWVSGAEESMLSM